MANKLSALSYTLVTAASVFLVSGLLVLTGGDTNHGKVGAVSVSDRQYSRH